MLLEAIALNSRGLALAATLESGQSFRWIKQADGSYDGVAGNRVCRVSIEGKKLLLHGCEERDIPFWTRYFDLTRDYAALEAAMRELPVFRDAVAYASGARLLHQEPWEALCCFIISQNNNVGRITSIVERLCSEFGAKLQNGRHGFPEPEALAGLSVEDLAPLRSGFRAKYILDAARKVAAGEIDLHVLYTLPLEEARAELTKIYGVGVKVADCALLYGFGRIESFPVDVWIKRAMQHFFPQGLPEQVLPFAGIAQLYLFHYARTCPGVFTQGEDGERRKQG